MKSIVISSLTLGILMLSAYSATESHSITQRCCTLRGSGIVNKVYIPPAAGRERYTRFDELDTEAEAGEQEPVLTLFQVDYDVEVPEAARPAIDYAFLLWQDLVHSEVPIKVHIRWVSETEEDTTLAYASASYYRLALGDNLLPLHYEPISVANRKNRYDLEPTINDIEISISANAPFYYGTDGQCPGYQYDLVSVILHEVAHGLGFSSFAQKLEDDDTLPEEVMGQLGFGNGLGLNFDYFLEDRSGLTLMDPVNFGNPSVELFEVFTSAQLYFSGPLAESANYGNRIPLAAPRVWNSGLSVLHLNEGSYPGASRNGLMTPWADLGEAIHDPGPITMGILGDIGWDYVWITQTERKDSEDLLNPFRFTAKIESDHPLQQLPILHYKRPADIGYSSAPMVADPLTGIFYADVPMDGNPTQIDYYVEAVAGAGRSFTNPISGMEQPLTVNMGPDLIAPTLSHTAGEFIFSSSKGLTLFFNADDNTELGLVQTEVWLDGVPQITSSYEARGETAFATTLTFTDLSPFQRLEYRFIVADRAAAQNTTVLPAQGMFSLPIEPVYAPVTTYATNFDAGAADLVLDGFAVGSVPGFQSPTLGTPHPYSFNGNYVDYYAYLRQQIVVQIGSTLSFDEVVLVEPGEAGALFGSAEFYDYVVVEASLDQGTTWFPISAGWDSTDMVEWVTAYNQSIDENLISTTAGDASMFRRRTLSLDAHPTINPGDAILIRFHLHSDPAAVGWGWAIDNLIIQPGSL